MTLPSRDREGAVPSRLHKPVSKWFLAALLGAIPLLAATPVIHSDLRKLGPDEADSLLRTFCTGGLQKMDQTGLKCVTSVSGPAFADIVDNHFYPEAVVYGRFLSAESDDAVVSGSSAETHPSLWGGTMLLTKRNGAWTPMWYKSAIITRSCQKVTTPGRREILLCEARNGGMGHRYHDVYSVDFLKPMTQMETLLARANSFQSGCVVRKQEIKALHWSQVKFRLAITVATPKWWRNSREACAGDPGPERRPPVERKLVFQLNNTGFRPAPFQK